MARVQVINSLKPEEGYGQQWRLILQWCRYFYDDGSIEHGYRFIRVTLEGRLQPLVDRYGCRRSRCAAKSGVLPVTPCPGCRSGTTCYTPRRDFPAHPIPSFA